MTVTGRLLPRRFSFDARDELFVVDKALEEVVPLPDQGCHGYKSSRTSVPWVFGRRVVQQEQTPLIAGQHHTQRVRNENGYGKTGRMRPD